MSFARSTKSRQARAANDLTSTRPGNFLRGERGEPGKNGLDGVPGLDGAPGLDGVPGVDGLNGKDGNNGRDGRDGKDGSPGERGPAGPAGPLGEMGRRGKHGPPGKQGPPGLPGVCMYRAKYDCGSLNQSSSSPEAALLVPPSMIGQEASSGEAFGVYERQVSVNEGDNIQLSCDAFGIPKPVYVWRRPDSESSTTILIDIATNLRVTSFPGGQLPLYHVDRLNSGNYQCVASNGVPPAAIKTINLNVNYAPTIRLYPGPSIYRVKMGTSLTIECLIEANPSSFSYWMFGRELLMSLAPPTAVDERLPERRSRKYAVTESAGQLLTEAHYTILTINITDISEKELGLYKCISKNLVGQSVGYAWLEADSLTADRPGLKDEMDIEATSREREDDDRKYRKMILQHDVERLDHSVGWPNYLIERSANYSTFGNELRHQLLLDSSKKRLQAESSGHNLSLESSIRTLNESVPLIQSPAGMERKLGTSRGSGELPVTNNSAVFKATDTSFEIRDPHRQKGETEGSASNDETDDSELCIVDKSMVSERSSRISAPLLDKIGKPVYVGSVSLNALNWWAIESKLEDGSERRQSNSRYYATSPNKSLTLFDYDNLAELLKDRQQHQQLDDSTMKFDDMKALSEATRLHQLKHPIKGSSHIVYGSHFWYLSQKNADGDLADGVPESMVVVAYDLLSGHYRYLNYEKKAITGLSGVVDHVKLASDENGVWLIMPISRRLHAFLLEVDSSGISIKHHVSMKLEWRMIGQMFIIDGILYGIKDRHVYTSKLQFAYDLYKCKLLPASYLNESHRTFTNHFGNTHMINYNPNEPQRLYTIDNGNLLWCPVKLFRTEADVFI